MTLRLRLTIGTGALLAAGTAVALLAAYVLVRHELRSEIDSALKSRASTIAEFAATRPSRPPNAPPSGRLPRTSLGEPDYYVQFVGSTAKVTLIPGEKVRLPLGAARAVAAGRHAAYFTDATVAGTHLRIYTRHIGNGAVQLARSVSDVDNALAWIRDVFIAVLSIALVSASALAYLVTRRTLRPVDRLTADAERIAATRDIRSRTDASRTDELGRLARAFNTMLAALGESMNAQRQLVADASHELRTPLTTARMNLESLERHPELAVEARQQNLRTAIAELEELTHLIDNLVALARGDARAPARIPVRLDELAEEVVATARRRTGREILTQLEPTVVEAAPDDVMTAIANLLDNAVKWSPPTAPIEVAVRDGAVTVRDFGPGISPDDREHIFDRFYRATTARTLPGSGLGLAIVRQVAEAHGGTIEVAEGQGAGSVFVLRLSPSGG